MDTNNYKNMDKTILIIIHKQPNCSLVPTTIHFMFYNIFESQLVNNTIKFIFFFFFFFGPFLLLNLFYLLYSNRN
jgi:hypothetical protein